MKPFEFLGSSFRARDEGQFQPWCNNDGIHWVLLVLAVSFITICCLGCCYPAASARSDIGLFRTHAWWAYPIYDVNERPT